MTHEAQYILDLENIESELPNFECYFIFENIEVFKCKNSLIFKGISNTSESNTVLSSVEVAAKIRPKLIIALDIISFIVGTPITTYDIVEHTYKELANNKLETSKANFFKFKDSNVTDILNEIIKSLEKNSFLVPSLLDKWNKANFLLFSDDSSVLYADEAILNYIHIFELLSETVKKDYDSQIENSLEYLIKEFYNQTSFYTNDINSKINENKKATKKLLVGEFPAFKDKLKYFLNKYQLLDENTSFFIDELIKLRNSIAHGRVMHNMNIMEYPLTPFFNISSTKRDAVNPLMFLTATCISKYIGINLWHNE